MEHKNVDCQEKYHSDGYGAVENENNGELI